MNTRRRIFDASKLARYGELPLTNVPMFREEEFSGCLLVFLPGQSLPRHRHEHEHEAFDVIAGHGTMWLDGQAVELSPGMTAFVPAGVEHGFQNTGRERWLIRATIHERTYFRKAARRAILKHLGRASK